MGGDLKPDVAHGELVEAFLKMGGKSTLRYNTQGSKYVNFFNILPGTISVESFAFDGKPDIEMRLLSKEEPLAFRVRVLPIASVLQKTPTDELSNLYSRTTPGGIEALHKQLSITGLYEVQDLNNYFRRSDTPFAKASAIRGKYFDRNQNIGFNVDGEKNFSLIRKEVAIQAKFYF